VNKYFTFVKKVVIDKIEYTVDLDIMAGMYGGTVDARRSQHVQGLKALKSYDISFYCIKNYSDGVDALADEFRPFLSHGLVKTMLEKLKSKFATIEHAGPADVIAFLELYEKEEAEMIRRNVFEHINRLIESLSG
jgi:hypothetical protein